MSDATNIFALMKQVDGLFGQVSRLLMTINAQLQQHRWISRTNVSLSNSGLIYKPDQWLPQDVFQFYKHTDERLAHLLPFVAVLLWDRDENLLPEPLISAGFIDNGRGNPVGNAWQYWFARLHLSHRDWKSDGTPFQTSGPALGKVGITFQTVASFARPLIAITNAEQADSLISRSLVKLLSEQAAASLV